MEPLRTSDQKASGYRYRIPQDSDIKFDKKIDVQKSVRSVCSLCSMPDESATYRKNLVHAFNAGMLGVGAVMGHGLYKSYNTYYRWSRKNTGLFALATLFIVV